MAPNNEINRGKKPHKWGLTAYGHAKTNNAAPKRAPFAWMPILSQGNGRNKSPEYLGITPYADGINCPKWANCDFLNIHPHGSHPTRTPHRRDADRIGFLTRPDGVSEDLVRFEFEAAHHLIDRQRGTYQSHRPRFFPRLITVNVEWGNRLPKLKFAKSGVTVDGANLV